MINSHSHIIADFAFQVGIDFNKVADRLYYQTNGRPISGRIAIDKEANEGNPYIFVNAPYVDKKGNKYPNITFGTHAHGGFTVNFNGYNESRADRPAWIDYSTKPIIKPIAQPKPVTVDTEKLKRFNLADTAFKAATRDGVDEHAYIVKKGVNTDGCDIRLVNGRVQYPIQNIDDDVISYQTIARDGFKMYHGGMSGGFTVIGDKDLIKSGTIFGEGMATALSTKHSETLNPEDKPVVCCLDAGNMPKVIAAFVAKYGKDIVDLYADNDCGLNSKGEFTGNTGVFHALEICHEHGIESFRMPVSIDGNGVDFNDTEEFMDIEVPTGIDYQIELIKVCPKQSLQKYFDDFTDDVIRDTKITAKTTHDTADYFTISECAELITSTAALRDNDDWGCVPEWTT